MYDVITIGETMLRFTPPGGLRWEQADRLEVHIGGSESNTAAGLARLGHRVAWVSRLTNHAFGRKIAGEIARHGVDISQIVWTDEDRIGTYYYETGSLPRSDRVVYDRAGSSFSRMTYADLPPNLLSPGATKWLHLTGISLGLGEFSREFMRKCAAAATTAGIQVSFDVNYRGKLWTPHDARLECEPIMRSAAVIFLPIRDARLVFEVEYADEHLLSETFECGRQVAQEFSQRFPGACLVLTLGRLGACAIHRGQFFFQPTSPVPVVSRLGGGDAFSAGFLSNWMRTSDVQSSLRWGNAAAGLKYSMPGDLPFFEFEEVRALAEGTAAAQPFR